MEVREIIRIFAGEIKKQIVMDKYDKKLYRAFIEGMMSVTPFQRNNYRIRTSKDDASLLSADWMAVGNDIRRSMNNQRVH